MNGDSKVYRQFFRVFTYVIWALGLLLIAGLPAEIADLLSKPLWAQILGLATAVFFIAVWLAFAVGWTWFLLPLVQELDE